LLVIPLIHKLNCLCVFDEFYSQGTSCAVAVNIVVNMQSYCHWKTALWLALGLSVLWMTITWKQTAL